MHPGGARFLRLRALGTQQGNFRQCPYRRANRLPRQLLHPRIAQTVWASFLRGDYDTAVFQAFKEVEVRVREAAEYADTELGTNLMRKAFKGDGPLVDAEAPGSEQQALSDLFAGAIGCYNPTAIAT